MRWQQARPDGTGRIRHPVHARRSTRRPRPLQGATGLSVAEGESAVFSPGAAGGPSLVARITAEEWQSLAQQG